MFALSDIYAIMTIIKLKSPFPYFGSKKRVADVIWSGLGNVSNYVEPFCGSLAILLANHNIPKIETVNDLDSVLVNFWRSVSKNPDEVAKYADFPVSQVELHARHTWLIENLTDDFRYKMEHDPEFFDSKMAGYWIYGQSASIGDNWLKTKGLKALPLLSSAGGGIRGLTYDIFEQFKKLQERLRRVRITCGDWKKIVSPSITYNNIGLGPKDITGVVLDSPYSLESRDKVYREESNIYKEVCKWAIDNGDHSKMRLVVCGYDGDVIFPDNWTKYNWKSSGLGNRSNDRGRENSSREVIYFSPNCLPISLPIG